MISKVRLKEIIDKDNEEKKQKKDEQKRIEREKETERAQTIFNEIIDGLDNKIIHAAKNGQYTLDIYTISNRHASVHKLVFDNLVSYLDKTDFKPQIKERKTIESPPFSFDDVEVHRKTIYIGLRG